MELGSQDEKLKVAKWLDDAERAGAVGTMIDSQHCVSVRPAEHSATVTQIESSKLLPYILVTCILSGLALGLAIVTLYVQATAYRELERETRLAQLQLDNVKVALLARGIDPAPHLPGEAP
jgi:hypothetical protein